MDVIVLDGREVPNPEDMAMIQALYSRSPQSVRLHLEKVKSSGSEKFHEKFYVGYGHKSIGDCGTITICVEDVSMLCAKAIQDNPLYNGQEASTRYLNFAERVMVNPLETKEGDEIQLEWLSIYKEVLATLVPHFERRFPIEEGQNRSVWKKAVKARAFDVARGFLPAGCTTFVAWHTNLRQANDHLSLMRHSPVAEIREVAGRIHEELLKTYPSSFGHKQYPESEAYLAKSVGRWAYSEHDTNPAFDCYSALDVVGLEKHKDLLESRPPKTELHQRFRQFGHFRFHFPLDFGSYRDLQRHRSCVQEMPLLTTKWGILPWYSDQLPEPFRADVLDRAKEIARRIDLLNVSPEERQNYIAMGYSCPVRITCPLPSAIYIAELRSGTTVHPTVRKVAQQIGETVKSTIPCIAMHHDMSEGVWDVKRGAQDIVQKEASCLE